MKKISRRSFLTAGSMTALAAAMAPAASAAEGENCLKVETKNVQLIGTVTDAGQVVSVGAHEHDVDAKGLIRQLPGFPDLLSHPLCRRAGRSDKAQAACVGNACRQVILRHPGHSALDDGILDS